MTRKFNRCATCPNCGYSMPLTDSFSLWMESHPELASDSITVMDKDIVVHRFKTNYGRAFQCIMFVEVKTHGAEPSDSQRDTMLMVGQIFRNRRVTPTKTIYRQCPAPPNEVVSYFRGRAIVKVKLFGYHLLTFSHNNPRDSSAIFWDKRAVDVDTLVKLLRFDMDPDTCEPMDWRKHHINHDQPTLFQFDGDGKP